MTTHKAPWPPANHFTDISERIEGINNATKALKGAALAIWRTAWVEGYEQSIRDMRKAHGTAQERSEPLGATRPEAEIEGEGFSPQGIEVSFRDSKGHAIPFEQALAWGYGGATTEPICLHGSD